MGARFFLKVIGRPDVVAEDSCKERSDMYLDWNASRAARRATIVQLACQMLLAVVRWMVSHWLGARLDEAKDE